LYHLGASKLAAKGKYGLKALVYLASLEKCETARSADIASSNNISKKFLDSVLADRHKAGFVDAKKDPGGDAPPTAHARIVGDNTHYYRFVTPTHQPPESFRLQKNSSVLDP
jgi:hypothetical protein